MTTKKDKHYAEAESRSDTSKKNRDILKYPEEEETKGQKDRETETERQRQKDIDRETKYGGRDEMRRCMWQQLERC